MLNMKNIITTHNKKIINHQKIILQEHATAQENNNAHLTKMSNQ